LFTRKWGACGRTPPWDIEDNGACFIVRDKNRQEALLQSFDDPKVANDTIAERFQRFLIGALSLAAIAFSRLGNSAVRSVSLLTKAGDRIKFDGTVCLRRIKEAGSSAFPPPSIHR
jgi:hypothetical protein